MSDDELQKKLDELTPTQCKVLYWVCRETPNAEIAKKLGREESTVESHITQIYAKLDIAGKTDRARAQQRQPYCALLLTNVKDPDTDCDKRRGTRTGPVGGPNDAGSHKTGSDNKSPDDSTSQKKEDEDSQPPDIVMPQRGWPRWLVPILALAAVLLVVVGFTLSTIFGGGDSATPTLLPTLTPARPAYAPSPTPVQIPVAPTLSDVQNPAPGSILSAGQAFSRRGITAMAQKDMTYPGRDYMFPSLEIRNGGGDPFLVRWKPSSLHLQDNTGRVYRQQDDTLAEYNSTFQFSLQPGEAVILHGGVTFGLSSPGYRTFGYFVGPIDPSVKYLVFRVDEIAGLTQLAWRFDL